MKYYIITFYFTSPLNERIARKVMIITAIILTSTLIVCLFLLSIIQSKHRLALEKKNSIISTQSKNIIFIDNVIGQLKDIPVSPVTMRILLERMLFCANKMIECFPQEVKYEEQRKNIILGIQQNNAASHKKPSPPKAVNEMHMISMIKTLKRTLTILNQEARRQPLSRKVVEKEIETTHFYINYLIINHYIRQADNAYEQKAYGTARDRYEAAQKRLDALKSLTSKKWAGNKSTYCNEQLVSINDKMKRMNESHVSNQPVIHDDTGLSRMMDGTKLRPADYR